MKKFFTIFILTIMLCSLLFSQKQQNSSLLEIIPDVEEPDELIGNMRVNKITGVPLALYMQDYKVSPASPEAMAREYLADNSSKLKIRADLNDLQFLSLRETPVGYHVRFQQLYRGYPVYRSTIVVNINRDNVVYFVMNGYKAVNENSKEFKFNAEINVSEMDALERAVNYLGVKGTINYRRVETVVYYNKGSYTLAQKVNIVPAEDKFGDWEILIDAASGDIFRVEDLSCSLHNHPGGETLADGSGWVFAPNPITRARTQYGAAGFLDNNDADSDSLTAQLVQVVLKNITFEGGVYKLKSNRAEIVDTESPYTGLHTIDSLNFHFKRAHDNFEAVNTFYSIATVMDWINDSLGISLMPFQYTGGVKFDPHGLSGADNSHYTPSTGQVAFGDGGVDDAEDPFVVVHELGHGIHDWATNGGLSQNQGLSEGCGDYTGMSYERSFGCLPSSHPAYNYAFNWDGHNPFWDGRITNYMAHYPEGLTGTIHTDGQMWASSLMTIYDQIGKKATDKNFVTALAMLNGTSNQRDAAMAFLQADQLNYGGSHAAVISTEFIWRGYLVGPITPDFTANVTGGQAPLVVNFQDISTGINPITSWQWDFNNDGIVDATVKNPQWTFTDNGVYTVKLTVSDGTNSASKTKQNYISVNSGVLVWEGVAGGTDYSGAFIRDYLIANNYEASYSTSMPSSLLGYEAVFLSFGNYGSGGTSRTEFTDELAAPVKAYLQAGGHVYLEGGDALGYDQDDDPVLLSLFGIASASDGSTAAITALNGKTGTLTNGMLFTGSTQVQNTYIDKYVAGGTGIISFSMGTYGDVSVQNSGTAGNKTFCFAYALKHLTDGTAPSTKAELLNKLLNFFEVEPIPVELTSFTASVNNGSVLLEWSTATETNNRGFSVERRKKDIEENFTSINFVQGKGSTTERTEYRYIDYPETGKYIYRLKQNDFDGTISYSNEIEVDLTLPLEYSLGQNYPNPFNPSTSIKFSIINEGFVNLSVYNLLGEKVAVLVNEQLSAGNYETFFNAYGLTSGTYIYRIETTGFTSSRKMMIIK